MIRISLELSMATCTWVTWVVISLGFFTFLHYNKCNITILFAGPRKSWLMLDWTFLKSYPTKYLALTYNCLMYGAWDFLTRIITASVRSRSGTFTLFTLICSLSGMASSRGRTLGRMGSWEPTAQSLQTQTLPTYSSPRIRSDLTRTSPRLECTEQLVAMEQ